MSRLRLAAAFAVLLAGAVDLRAERFVLAWPPTRYASAELVVWRSAGSPAGPLSVRLSGRGFDLVAEVPTDGALRVPLPPEARCAPGRDACAILVESESGTGAFEVLLQSPDTAGVPDTLLRTAHDTVRVPSAAGGGRRHVLLSTPVAPGLAESMSFASIVPLRGRARVVLAASCAGARDETLELPEVLTLSCQAAGEDLSGTLLVSDAPVLVLSGNVAAALPDRPGLSADLILDLSPPLEGLEEASTWIATPLPRAASHAGLGDLVRVVAAGPALVRVRDDAGLDELHALVAGEVLELDSAGAAGDRLLRLDASGPVAAWQLPKSRALRGRGDPAALPLVPRERFTLQDRVFVPDGYGEGAALVVVAEPGAAVSLDGAALGAFLPVVGEDLEWLVVELPPPPSGEGRVLELRGAAPFGAWLLGQGGYKAQGLAAAWARPRSPSLVLRGDRPDALGPLAESFEGAFVDAEPGAPWFWRIDDEVLLRVSACGESSCLDW